jgi:hypothetical protein
MNTRDLLLAIALILAIVWWLGPSSNYKNVVRYDCRLSEISPDFPPQVREACRKKRAEREEKKK